MNLIVNQVAFGNVSQQPILPAADSDAHNIWRLDAKEVLRPSWLDAQSSTFQFIIETLTPHVSASIISKVCANKGNSRRIKVEEDGNCHEITNNKISFERGPLGERGPN